MDMGASPHSRFFLLMTCGFLAVALTGFSTTFFIPLAHGTFSAPLVVHIHGAMLFGWLVFLILQASLIASRSHPLHRQLGWFGAALCAAIVVSGVLVGLHATRRDLAAGGDDVVLGNFVNILIEMTLFGSLVAAAIVLRRDSQTHKRLLLLATISVIAPAWSRLRHIFPEVPDPFLTFSLLADSLILVATLYDWVAHKQVHRVYVWVGGPLVAVHLIELFAIRSASWVQLSRWLLGEPAA